MELSRIGKIAKEYWLEIPKHFENMQLDEYAIMPNHVHGIIIIQNVGVQNFEPLQNKYQHIIPKSVGSAIRAYKSTVTQWCRNNDFEYSPWQRGFYEHVVRNEDELNRIREYIINNPLKWQLDRENPLSINYNLDYKRYFEEIYEG